MRVTMLSEAVSFNGINQKVNMKKSVFGFSICSLIVACLLLFTSCNKTTETFSTPQLNDYYPLQIGKYITYQLDSLVYYSFGTRDSISHNQVKYTVDSLLTDNLGRPAYRIYKYFRKTANDTWVPQATFWAINDGSKIEFIEDNLRYIKMILPIQNDKSWKGNIYLQHYISNNLDHSYLDNWDYYYSNVGGADNVNNFSFENTLTINQRDDVSGIPGNPDAFSEINFAQEKYALGIGMIYKTFLHKEYQPDNNGGGAVQDGSYGVTYTMIDHN